MWKICHVSIAWRTLLTAIREWMVQSDRRAEFKSSLYDVGPGKEPFSCPCSVIQSCWNFGTPWTAARQASLSFSISRSLPKVIALVIPCRHLVLWHPLLLLPSIFLSIRDFSHEFSACFRWPKYLAWLLFHLQTYLFCEAKLGLLLNTLAIYFMWIYHSWVHDYNTYT